MNINICKHCGRGVINNNVCIPGCSVPKHNKGVMRSGFGACVFTIGILLLGVQSPQSEQSVLEERAFWESSFSEEDSRRITMLEPESIFLDDENVNFYPVLEAE